MMENYEKGKIYKIADDYDNIIWRGVTFIALEDAPYATFDAVDVVILHVPDGNGTHLQVGVKRSVCLDNTARLVVVPNPFKVLPNAESFEVGSVLGAGEKLFVKVREDTWHSYMENTFCSIYSDKSLDKHELAEVDSYVVTTPDGEERTY